MPLSALPILNYVLSEIVGNHADRSTSTINRLIRRKNLLPKA
jgi:hypothetical protein